MIKGKGAQLRSQRAWRERKKKESERENRKNATGRKYVVEIALCRGGAGDRPFVGSPFYVWQGAAFARGKCRSVGGKDGKGCRYNVYLPRMYSPCVHFRTAHVAGDRKNLPKFADRNRVLFGDLPLSDHPLSLRSLFTSGVVRLSWRMYI